MPPNKFLYGTHLYAQSHGQGKERKGKAWQGNVTGWMQWIDGLWMNDGWKGLIHKYRQIYTDRHGDRFGWIDGSD